MLMSVKNSTHGFDPCRRNSQIDCVPIENAVITSDTCNTHYEDDTTLAIAIVETEQARVQTGEHFKTCEKDAVRRNKLRIKVSDVRLFHMSKSRAYTDRFLVNNDSGLLSSCFLSKPILLWLLLNRFKGTDSDNKMLRESIEIFHPHLNVYVSLQHYSHCMANSISDDEIDIIATFGKRLRIRLVADIFGTEVAGSSLPLAIRGRYHDLHLDNNLRTLALDVYPCLLMFYERTNIPNGGTGCTVWDGAVLVARYLEARVSGHKQHSKEIRENSQTIIRQKPASSEEGYVHDVRNVSLIVELGSGCGVAGITAAALGCPSVLLTDLEDIIPLLQSNIDKNIPALRAQEHRSDGQSTEWGKNQSLACSALDWTKPFSVDLSPYFRKIACAGANHVLLLAADCIWIEELVVPLLETIQNIINTLVVCDSDCNVSVLICYQRRGKATDEAFWDGLNSAFPELGQLSVLDSDVMESLGVTVPDCFYFISCHHKIRKSNK